MKDLINDYIFTITILEFNKDGRSESLTDYYIDLTQKYFNETLTVKGYNDYKKTLKEFKTSINKRTK